MKYGLLIDYEYCCDCHTCEVACQKEHGFAPGQFGIHVLAEGPWDIEGTKRHNYDCYPMPTELCNLCGERTAAGKRPACVHNCMTQCLTYGPVDELSKKLEEKSRQLLVVPPCA